MSFIQNDQWSERLQESFEELVGDWKDALQLANAYYGLYKSERNRVDALESQIRSLIQVHPLNKKDWSDLQARVEKHES